MTLLELKEKEFGLRFRTIPEISDEDIKEKIIKLLGNFLNCEEKDTEAEIDKVYRIKSRSATRRNVSRNVLNHFVRKKPTGLDCSKVLALS